MARCPDHFYDCLQRVRAQERVLALFPDSPAGLPRMSALGLTYRKGLLSTTSRPSILRVAPSSLLVTQPRLVERPAAGNAEGRHAYRGVGDDELRLLVQALGVSHPWSPLPSGAIPFSYQSSMR